MRHFTSPSHGQTSSAPAVRLIPTQDVSAAAPSINVSTASTATYGASRKKLIATHRCARRSAFGRQRPGSGEPPNDNDARKALDGTIEAKGDERDRPSEHARDHTDNTLDPEPYERQRRQQLRHAREA